MVIYHARIVYYDGQGGIFKAKAIPPFGDETVWTSDLWCLLDAKGRTPGDLSQLPYEDCSFVVSTSPRRDLVNDYQKVSYPQVSLKFFMPLWSHSELKMIARYFTVSKDWEYRFKVLGGIPRFVLEDTSTKATAIMEKACKSCEIESRDD